MAFDNCPFNLTPLDQSSTINNSPIVNLNYTNQDFWSMKARLIDYINQQFGDNFNDFVEGDLAVMLIENWAFLADTLSFKMDQIANEIFIDTVTEVDNAFRLAKLVGFQPQPPIAAISMWQATINNVQTTDLYIPPGVQVSVSGTNGATVIELFAGDAYNNPLLDQNIVIPAGTLQNNTIVGLEGRTIVDVFSGNGDVGQTVQLSVYPVIWNSVQVQVDGKKWNQVDYFTDSNPRQEYRVEFDSSYRAYVIFGNNQAGFIPSRGSTIRVTYRNGGGTVGNIVTGSVQSQRSFPLAGSDTNIPVTFSNYTSGSFGYDGDGIDDIRSKLPAYLRTQDRCVTGLDYKTLSDQFATPYNGIVGKSTAVLRNYGCAANIVDLYILAQSGGNLLAATDGLKQALQTEIDSVKMISDQVCIRDGVIILVDVAIDITMNTFYRNFEDEISAKVQTRVTNFFNINNWDYGQTLKDTNLIKSMSDISEIEDLAVTFTTNDPENGGSVVVAEFYEIIQEDTTTINFLYD